MKRKLFKIAIFALLFALSVTALALAACKPDDPVTPPGPEPSAQVTVTVDFDLEGAEDATFTIDAGANFYSRLQEVVRPITGLVFDGYYLDGVAVTAQTAAPDHDFTVTAHWLVPYSVEVYLEDL